MEKSAAGVAQSRWSEPFRVARAACFEHPAGVFAGCVASRRRILNRKGRFGGESGVELRLIHERELFRGGKYGGIAGRADNDGEKGEVKASWAGGEVDYE